MSAASSKRIRGYGAFGERALPSVSGGLVGIGYAGRAVSPKPSWVKFGALGERALPLVSGGLVGIGYAGRAVSPKPSWVKFGALGERALPSDSILSSRRTP